MVKPPNVRTKNNQLFAFSQLVVDTSAHVMTCAADIYLTIKTVEVGHTVEFAEPSVSDVYGVTNQALPHIHLETSSLLGKPQLPIS